MILLLRPTTAGHTRPVEKGMKVRRCIIPVQPPSFSQDRQKNRHIVVSLSKAASNIVKYDPIGANQSRKDVTEQRAQLSMDYKDSSVDQLLECVLDGPGDV